jgi:hypothetical protein
MQQLRQLRHVGRDPAVRDLIEENKMTNKVQTDNGRRQ